MKISIIGATGSTGAYFAYKLMDSDNEISLIGRAESPTLLKAQAGQLSIEIGSECHLLNRFKYIGPYTNQLPTQDLVIVALKQPDLTLQVINQIISLTNENSFIGFISNGLPFYFLQGLSTLVGKEYVVSVDENGEINSLLAGKKIIAILPAIGSHRESSGKVIVTTKPDNIKVVMGPLIKEENIEPIAEIFGRAGITTILNQDNMHKAILEKLQFALSINVMSALLERSNGDIFETEDTQKYIEYVISFVNQLSQNLGLGDLPDYDQFKSKVISKLHYSSMYQDIKSGKVPEIDVIISSPIELANFLEEKMLISAKPLTTIKELLQAKTSGIPIEKERIDQLHKQAESALRFIDKRTYIELLGKFFQEVEVGKPDPIMYVICGGPGSGKSTFYKQAFNLGLIPKEAHHHEPDMVMLALPGYQKDVDEYGLKQARNNWNDPALKLANAMLNKAIEDKSHIIYERTCGMQDSYDFLKEVSTKGYKIIIHGLFIPIDIAIERTHERENKIGRHIPDEIVIERTAKLSSLWEQYIKLANQAKLYISQNNDFVEIKVGDNAYENFKLLGYQSNDFSNENIQQKHWVPLSLAQSDDTKLITHTGEVKAISSDLLIQIGLIIGNKIVSPVISYLNDRITGANEAKSLLDHYSRLFNEDSIIKTSIFFITSYAIPNSCSIANKIFVAKLLSDSIYNEISFSREYALSMLDSLAKSFISFSIIKTGEQYGFHESHPFSLGMLAGTINDLIKLPCDVALSYYDYIMGEVQLVYGNVNEPFLGAIKD